MEEKNLLSVHIGDSATVSQLHMADTARRRLLDLGLTPGANITCLYAAPSGNPKAYLIRGTVIALRNQEAALVSLSGV